MSITAERREQLFRDIQRENSDATTVDYRLPVLLELSDLLILISNLQLALRHPKNSGPSASITRQAIDQLIARLRTDGWTAHAELAAPRFGAVSTRERRWSNPAAL